jgi:DNA-binding HxlR family transcriptional regulator
MKKDSHIPDRRSHCPISLALDAVGDKWSLIILRDMMFTGKRTYGELQSSEEGIATNILAARLVSLESNGIIVKTPGTSAGHRPVYSLSEKGIGLLPVVMELQWWMIQNDSSVVACTEEMKSFDKNRSQLIAAQTKKLRKEHLEPRLKVREIR